MILDGHDRDVRKYPSLGHFRFHLGDNVNDQIIPGEKRTGFVADGTYVNITQIDIKEDKLIEKVKETNHKIFFIIVWFRHTQKS